MRERPEADVQPTPDPQVLERRRREKAWLEARMRLYRERIRLYDTRWRDRVDFMEPAQ